MHTCSERERGRIRWQLSSSTLSLSHSLVRSCEKTIFCCINPISPRLTKRRERKPSKPLSPPPLLPLWLHLGNLWTALFLFSFLLPKRFIIPTFVSLDHLLLANVHCRGGLHLLLYSSPFCRDGRRQGQHETLARS